MPIPFTLPSTRMLLVVPMEDSTNQLATLIRRRMEDWMASHPMARAAMERSLGSFPRPPSGGRIREWDRSHSPGRRSRSKSPGKPERKERNRRVLMDWTITNTEGRVLAFANKDAYTERMAASRAMVRAMSNDKQAMLIRDGSLLIHQLWDRVVRASRDFATAGRDAAFPHMGQLQELVGIPALQSPHRLSRVLHFGGWVGYSGVSLRWFTQQCEEAYTVWGPEVSLDGKRMVWYAIQRVETMLTIFFDESFTGTLSGWAAITRGEFSKNSDGAIRALFEEKYLRYPVIDKFDRAIHRPLFSENHEGVSANQLLASINVVLCILHTCYRYFRGAGTLSLAISLFSDQFLTHISCLDLRCC